MTLFRRFWFNKYKQPIVNPEPGEYNSAKRSMRVMPLEEDPEFDGYYTVVIDVEAFKEWVKGMKAACPGLTEEKIAKAIGYGKSHLSQILNDMKVKPGGKYDIEISGRFIGTFLWTWFKIGRFGIFKVVPAIHTGNHQQDKPVNGKRGVKYDPVANFRRQKDRYPMAECAR